MCVRVCVFQDTGNMDTNLLISVTCREERISDEHIKANFMQESNVLPQTETEVNSISKDLLVIVRNLREG